MAPERQTQNRIMRLFQNDLGYESLGSLQSASDNDNIIDDKLGKYLRGRGYQANWISRAVDKLRAAANEPGKSLYDRNHAVYKLLRYGVPIKPGPGLPTETIRLIDWEAAANNDFYVAEEVTYRGKKE